MHTHAYFHSPFLVIFIGLKITKKKKSTSQFVIFASLTTFSTAVLQITLFSSTLFHYNDGKNKIDFLPGLLSERSLHALPMVTYILSRYTCFLSCPKAVYVSFFGVSKLSPCRWVHVDMWVHPVIEWNAVQGCYCLVPWASRIDSDHPQPWTGIIG